MTGERHIGKTCRFGHSGERLADGHCAECRRIYQREYQRLYMKKLRANPFFREKEKIASRARMWLMRATRM